MSGSASILPITTGRPDQDPALRPPQQLVPREEHEVSARGNPLGDKRFVADSRRLPRRQGTRPDVVDHRQPAVVGKLGQTVQRCLLGETDDPEVAVMDPQNGRRLGADRPLVIRQPGLVGRAHLAQPGPRDLEDLRQPEAAADLDELTPRYDDFAAGGQYAQGQNRGARVVVDHRRRLGPGQFSQEPRDARGPPTPLSLLELEFEVAVSPGHRGDGFHRLLRQRSPPQPGMKQDPGRVDHGAEQGPGIQDNLPGSSGQAERIDGRVLAVLKTQPGLANRGRTARTTGSRPRSCRTAASSSCSSTALTGGNCLNASGAI